MLLCVHVTFDRMLLTQICVGDMKNLACMPPPSLTSLFMHVGHPYIPLINNYASSHTRGLDPAHTVRGLHRMCVVI